MSHRLWSTTKIDELTYHPLQVPLKTNCACVGKLQQSRVPDNSERCQPPEWLRCLASQQTTSNYASNKGLLLGIFPLPLRKSVFQCSQLSRKAPRLASDQNEKQTGKLGERKLFNICCNHVTSVKTASTIYDWLSFGIWKISCAWVLALPPIIVKQGIAPFHIILNFVSTIAQGIVSILNEKSHK